LADRQEVLLPASEVFAECGAYSVKKMTALTYGVDNIRPSTEQS